MPKSVSPNPIPIPFAVSYVPIPMASPSLGLISNFSIVGGLTLELDKFLLKFEAVSLVVCFGRIPL